MELWIRTQDRTKLLVVKELELQNAVHQKLTVIWGGTKDNYRLLGRYTTEERALQVMDEIQKTIENKFLIKCHPLMKKQDLEIAKLQIEELNNIKCIMSEDRFEIEPINKECIIYEMPKE